MAQRVQVLLVDDLDGSTATETVTFGLDGVTYKIDLSKSNAETFRSELAPWTQAGRKVSGKVTGVVRRPADAEISKMREWARANGFTVSDRGRISSEIQEAYRQANQ